MNPKEVEGQDDKRNDVTEVFVEASERYGEEHKQERVTTPDLFHYTSAEGLHGIVSTSSIFSTHIKFLNDTSEVTHAYEIAEKVFKELAAQTSPVEGLPSSRVTEYGEFFFKGSDILSAEDAYVTSFCESDDLLSQWRGYAMGGFAIGVGPLFSESNIAIRSPLWRMTISRVEYEYKPKMAELLRILAGSIKAADKVPAGPKQDSIRRMVRTIGSLDLQKWVHSVKHEKFKEEREWRLISFSAPTMAQPKLDEGVFVRLSTGRLLPTIRMTGRDGKQLPIKSVTCGPNSDRDLTEKAVRYLLESKGYDSVQVRTSEIPFRAK